MKTLSLLLRYLIVSIIIAFSSCLREGSESSSVSSLARVPPGLAGSANVTIQIGKIGTLSKSATSTPMTLCSLYVALTASGETPVNWVTPISGTELITVSRTFTGLAAKPTFLFAETRDTRNVLIHSSSTSFTIVRKQTLNVNLSLFSNYSILVAKFYPIRDSVNRCILLVDGISRSDSTFAKQTHLGDTIPLRYDYLGTGTTHNISLRARGLLWGIDTLLYTCDTALTAIAGVDSPFRVTLKWVGPAKPPPGQSEMFVSVGAIGTVTVQGRIGE